VNTFSSSNWIKERALKDDEVVNAVFVLKHDRSAVEAFEKNLLELATPSSPKYGKWLKVSNFFHHIFPIE